MPAGSPISFSNLSAISSEPRISLDPPKVTKDDLGAGRRPSTALLSGTKGRRLRSASFVRNVWLSRYSRGHARVLPCGSSLQGWMSYPGLSPVLVSVVSLALAVYLSLITILAGEPPVAPFGAGTVLPPSPLAIGSGIFLATAQCPGSLRPA